MYRRRRGPHERGKAGGGASLESDAIMISLTGLNNWPLLVNSDLIKFVENAPDTVITLVTGEKIVVLETAEQVLDRILAFRQRLLVGLSPANRETVPADPGNSGLVETSQVTS